MSTDQVAEPNACALCGRAQRNHGIHYVTSAGIHSFTSPTDKQRLDRMLARRNKESK